MTETSYSKSLIEAIYLRYQREAQSLEIEYTANGEPDVLERIVELKALCVQLSFKLAQLEDVGGWIATTKPNTSPLMTRKEQELAAAMDYPGFRADRMRQLTEDMPDETIPSERIRRLH